MSRYILAILLFFSSYSICKAQTEDSYQETGFVSDANYNLIEKMVITFENQICKYYSINKEESNLAFHKYIQDLKNSKIDVNNLVSDKVNALLKKSSKNHLGYIWITNKDKRSRWRIKNHGTDEFVIKSDNKRLIKRFQKRLKATENNLSIDYQTSFVKDFLENTHCKDLKDIVYTLKSKSGSDPPYLIASGLSSISKEDHNDISLKTFIAFELFYAYLNILQNE